MKTNKKNNVVYHEQDRGYSAPRGFGAVETRRIREKPKFLDSVICNIIDFKFTYHPIVIFSDQWYCYYLKCYNATNTDGTPRQQLFGDVKIQGTKPGNVKRPAFLGRNNYVDTACLYKMKKDEFEYVCINKGISYAEIDSGGILRDDQVAVLEQLIENLQNKEVELIICSFSLRAVHEELPTRTFFTVQYCHQKVCEKEKDFLESRGFPYKFKSKEEKDIYRKLMQLKFGEMNLKNVSFITDIVNEQVPNIFAQCARSCAGVLNKILQKK